MATSRTPEAIPAVFRTREDAEAAISELRGLGLRDEDIGVLVADPGRHRLVDDSARRALSGVTRGVVGGIPAGSLGGIGLTALALPDVGLIGLGGLLVGAVGGAIWGSVVGSLQGLIARVRWNAGEDAWCEVPVGSEEILVVARAGGRGQQALRVMEQHGARCFLDQASLEEAWREIEAREAR